MTKTGCNATVGAVISVVPGSAVVVAVPPVSASFLLPRPFFELLAAPRFRARSRLLEDDRLSSPSLIAASSAYSSSESESSDASYVASSYFLPSPRFDLLFCFDFDFLLPGSSSNQLLYEFSLYVRLLFLNRG